MNKREGHTPGPLTRLPLAPLSAVQSDPLSLAWRDVELLARGIIPTRIVGEPDMADAKNLIDDLQVAARAFDRLVLAYGEYAHAHLGVSVADVNDCFAHQLSNALEGNAYHVIERAVLDRIDSRRDEEADRIIDLRRGK